MPNAFSHKIAGQYYNHLSIQSLVRRLLKSKMDNAPLKFDPLKFPEGDFFKETKKGKLHFALAQNIRED